jgi:hypothetical protein
VTDLDESVDVQIKNTSHTANGIAGTMSGTRDLRRRIASMVHLV